jgi:hypothetical protein
LLEPNTRNGIVISINNDITLSITEILSRAIALSVFVKIDLMIDMDKTKRSTKCENLIINIRAIIKRTKCNILIFDITT